MTTARGRILVVEDERLVAREIAENLREFGYEVPATAATAEEALDLAERTSPDLVLLDIRIRGARDGVDVASALRVRLKIPVVYLTACTDTDTLARAEQTEPYAYLIKPIKPIELRSAVETALYKSELDRNLRKRESWLTTILRSIGDAIIATDAEGRVTFMNRAAETLTGVSASAASAQPIHNVLEFVDEHTKSAVEHPIVRALRERMAHELPRGAVLKDRAGNEHYVEDSATPIVDEAGAVLGGVSVLRDVGEQRRMLRQAELNDRLAALGTLAAGVAHEVNNPLAFILGNLQYALGELEGLEAMAKNGGVDAEALSTRVHEVCAALADAQTGSERIRRIVSELRRLSRPTVEKREELDLRHVADTALAMTARELSERARVIREFGEPVRVLGDDTRLTQVFVNLLVNAAHAIAPGRAEENEIRVVTGVDEQGNAFAEIRDTGSGIPREVIPRIFEPFFTTRALETGTGLGLSISHGIVSSLGGTIQVQSRMGVGSVFRVVLPPAPGGALPARAARTAFVDRSGPARARLLVVDDERFLLDTIARTLDEHYDVTKAHGGREALETFERGERFDLILCDLLMPEITGMDLFAELSERFPEQARRTVFMTGGAFTPKAQQFLCSGAHRVIEKPFNNAELLAFLAEWLPAED